jgi:hypothetical protein
MRRPTVLLSFRSLEMSKPVTREQSRRRPTEARCEGITSDDRMPIQGRDPASTRCLLLWLSVL